MPDYVTGLLTCLHPHVSNPEFLKPPTPFRETTVETPPEKYPEDPLGLPWNMKDFPSREKRLAGPKHHSPV